MERKTIINTALAGSVSVGCFGLAACERGETEPGSEPAQPLQEVTVEEVEEQPAAFAGKQLTLAGEVDEVYNDRAFMLEGNDWLFDDEILTVTRSPVRLAGGPPKDDDDVIVTGTVQQLDIVELEREIGWDLDPQLEIEIRNKPVLVADSIRAVDEAARWSEADEPQGTIVSVWSFYAVPDPSALQGSTLDLTDVPVQAKAGEGLWIGFSHRNQFFTTLPEGFDPTTVGFGDRVDVKGTLQLMPPVDEAMAKWSFPETLRSQIDEETFYVEATEISKSQAQPEKAAMAQPGQPTLQQRLDQLSELSDDLGIEYEAQGGMVPIEAYASTPKEHAGLGVYGEATVTEVMPPQGSFVAEAKNGKEVVVRIHQTDPGQTPVDLKKGETVRFTAMALQPDQLGKLEPQPDGNLEKMVEEHDGFLAVNAKSLQIVGSDGEGRMPGQNRMQQHNEQMQEHMRGQGKTMGHEEVPHKSPRDTGHEEVPHRY